jgi:hypothetical protein
MVYLLNKKRSSLLKEGVGGAGQMLSAFKTQQRRKLSANILYVPINMLTNIRNRHLSSQCSLKPMEVDSE